MGIGMWCRFWCFHSAVHARVLPNWISLGCSVKTLYTFNHVHLLTFWLIFHWITLLWATVGHTQVGCAPKDWNPRISPMHDIRPSALLLSWRDVVHYPSLVEPNMYAESPEPVLTPKMKDVHPFVLLHVHQYICSTSIAAVGFAGRFQC